MIRRASIGDAGDINRIFAREFNGEADFSIFLESPLNICLRTDDGAAFFVWRGPGIYETHCCFAERGKQVRELSKEILGIMRREYGARLIWAAIPNNTPKVKTYVRWLGFKPAGHVSLPHGECQLFTLEM